MDLSTHSCLPNNPLQPNNPLSTPLQPKKLIYKGAASAMVTPRGSRRLDTLPGLNSLSGLSGLNSPSQTLRPKRPKRPNSPSQKHFLPAKHFLPVRPSTSFRSSGPLGTDTPSLSGSQCSRAHRGRPRVVCASRRSPEQAFRLRGLQPFCPARSSPPRRAAQGSPEGRARASSRTPRPCSRDGAVG